MADESHTHFLSSDTSMLVPNLMCFKGPLLLRAALKTKYLTISHIEQAFNENTFFFKRVRDVTETKKGGGNNYNGDMLLKTSNNSVGPSSSSSGAK